MTPPPTVAPEATFIFRADLRAANEVPPVTDAEASCLGQVIVTLHVIRDPAGGATLGGAPKNVAATMQFDLTISGCPTTTLITLFHIHQSEAGSNGEVVVDSGQQPSDPIALTTGATAGTITKTSLTVKPEVANTFLMLPWTYYFNVHSKLHPDGMIRGQLRTCSLSNGTMVCQPDAGR